MALYLTATHGPLYDHPLATHGPLAHGHLWPSNAIFFEHRFTTPLITTIGPPRSTQPTTINTVKIPNATQLHGLTYRVIQLNNMHVYSMIFSLGLLIFYQRVFYSSICNLTVLIVLTCKGVTHQNHRSNRKYYRNSKGYNTKKLSHKSSHNRLCSHNRFSGYG